jgi:hypothetical protein
MSGVEVGNEGKEKNGKRKDGSLTVTRWWIAVACGGALFFFVFGGKRDMLVIYQYIQMQPPI